MMRLTTLRDYFREMAQSEHLEDCPSVTARESFWQHWALVEGEDGAPSSMYWRGPKPKWEPPRCDGCLSDEDRAWFARLAVELDGYVGDQGTLDLPTDGSVLTKALPGAP